MKYKIIYKSIGGADNLGNRIQFNNQSLRVAVQLWYDNEEQAREQYGDIDEWNEADESQDQGLPASISLAAQSQQKQFMKQSVLGRTNRKFR